MKSCGEAMRNVALFVLWLSGGLIVLAGGLHLLMTTHLMHWFSGSVTGPHASTATAAMLLNHLVVGILLLPLGLSLAFTAVPLARKQSWALAIAVGDAVALASLPVVLLLVTRSAMLESPVFVAAAAMLSIAAVLVGGAVGYLGLASPSASNRTPE
jgi:hypothetical protein